MKQFNLFILQRSLGNPALSDSRKLQNLHPKIQSLLLMLMMPISKPNYFNQSTVRFKMAALKVK